MSGLRERIACHAREVAALGVGGWFGLKVQKARARSAPKGTVLPLRTPLRPEPLLFRAGTSDLDAFWQIVVEDEYRCLADLGDVDLVIDCGANVGYSSAHFLARHPRARVIAVEPDPGNFEILRRNVAPAADRCTLLCTGVWSRPAGLVFAETRMAGGGEWGIMVREAAPGEPVAMQAVDIGTLLTQSGRSRISVLKIDIEGSEREVFARRPPWIGAVDNLVIELHGSECESVVYAALEGCGFRVSRSGELHVFRRN